MELPWKFINIFPFLAHCVVHVCPWNIMYQQHKNSLWSNAFRSTYASSHQVGDWKKSPLVSHSARMTSRWNVPSKLWTLSTGSSDRSKSFDSWAIKRWWTSWRPIWVVFYHHPDPPKLKKKVGHTISLTVMFLHKLQMTIK